MREPTSQMLADRSARIAADRAERVAKGTKPCPKGCGEDMTWEPSHPAERDCNVPAWRGGFCCTHCDHMEERDAPDEA